MSKSQVDEKWYNKIYKNNTEIVFCMYFILRLHITSWRWNMRSSNFITKKANKILKILRFLIKYFYRPNQYTYINSFVFRRFLFLIIWPFSIAKEEKGKKTDLPTLCSMKWQCSCSKYWWQKIRENECFSARLTALVVTYFLRPIQSSKHEWTSTIHALVCLKSIYGTTERIVPVVSSTPAADANLP